MNLKDKINKIINSFYKKFGNHEIIIIANTRYDTKDYKDLQLDSANDVEFFSESEFEEMDMFGFRKMKNFTKYYFNELDFISDVLEKKLDIDKIVVFNMARNGKKQGKKSLIPSFCDLLNIPYTGSNAFVQSLCRNKYVYTYYLEKHNITMPTTFAFNIDNTWQPFPPPTKFIIKPVAESGSIGVSQTADFFEFLKLKNVDFINNNQILFQEYLDGHEYEVPVLIIDNEIIPLSPMRIICKYKYLNEKTSNNNDYEYKFIDNNSKHTLKLQETAIKVTRLLGIENYGRIDFRINSRNEPCIIDISTTPYLSMHSSFYHNFVDRMKLSYTNIFELITALALLKQKIDNRLK